MRPILRRSGGLRRRSVRLWKQRQLRGIFLCFFLNHAVTEEKFTVWPPVAPSHLSDERPQLSWQQPAAGRRAPDVRGCSGFFTSAILIYPALVKTTEEDEDQETERRRGAGLQLLPPASILLVYNQRDGRFIQSSAKLIWKDGPICKRPLGAFQRGRGGRSGKSAVSGLQSRLPSCLVHTNTNPIWASQSFSECHPVTPDDIIQAWFSSPISGDEGMTANGAILDDVFLWVLENRIPQTCSKSVSQ